MLFGLVSRTDVTGSGAKYQSLAEAANAAMNTAKRERLPLASVANRNQPARPQYWFATNMLSIVRVEGRLDSDTSRQELTKELRNGLILSDDMNALLAAGEEEPRFIDLVVTRAEFKKYLNWMRSVQ